MLFVRIYSGFNLIYQCYVTACSLKSFSSSKNQQCWWETGCSGILTKVNVNTAAKHLGYVVCCSAIKGLTENQWYYCDVINDKSKIDRNNNNIKKNRQVERGVEANIQFGRCWLSDNGFATKLTPCFESTFVSFPEMSHFTDYIMIRVHTDGQQYVWHW